MRHSSALASLILAISLLLGGMHAAAQEGEASAVEQALERVERALNDEPGLAPETKAALQDLVRALRQERQAPAAPPAKASVTPQQNRPAVEEIPISDRPFLERVRFFGNIRLRYESQFELDTASTRHRARVRFQPAMEVAVSDQITIGARLTTGDPENITTTNQTLDDVFDKFEISLDRVYIAYEPTRLPNSYAKAGKFGAPWRKTPIYNGMTWDSDAQPEGVALGYTLKDVGFFNEIGFSVTQLFVEETSGMEDAFGTVFQIAGDLDLSDTFNLETGVTYFSWSDLEIDGSLSYLVPDDKGNVLIDTDGDGKADDFDSDFGVLHPYAVLRYSGWKHPVTFVGEYVNNLRANNGRDQGWSFGASVGRGKKKGEWQTFYQWVVIEQDAVLDVVNADDFSIHSGFRGHHFGLKYKLTDRIEFKPNAYVYYREHPDESIGEDDNYQWKTRLDLTVKF